MWVLSPEHRVSPGGALEGTDGTGKIGLLPDANPALKHEESSTESCVSARDMLARVAVEPITVRAAEDQVRRDLTLDRAQAGLVAALADQSDADSKPFHQAHVIYLWVKGQWHADAL